MSQHSRMSDSHTNVSLVVLPTELQLQIMSHLRSPPSLHARHPNRENTQRGPPIMVDSFAPYVKHHQHYHLNKLAGQLHSWTYNIFASLTQSCTLLFRHPLIWSS